MLLLIFDIDGTIFINNDSATLSYSKAVDSLFGIKRYTKDWDTYFNTSDVGILREICKRYRNVELIWDDILDFEELYYKYFKKLAIENVETFQTTKGFVELYTELLGEKGIRVAIYTGGMRKVALEKLDSIGICERKCAIATAQDGLTREEILKAVIYKSHVMYDIEKFDRIIIIGDSRRDIQVAQNNKIPIIIVENTMNRNDIRECGVKYIIKDFANFTKMLNKVLEKDTGVKCQLLI